MKHISGMSLLCAFALLAGCGGGSGSGNATSATTRYAITDLGGNFTTSQAFGLNNQGQVVGTASTRYIGGAQPNGTVTPGDSQYTSFLYANGSVTNIPVGGLAINDSGQIVGSGGIYQNNAVTPIPSLAHSPTTGVTFSADARAINNQGQVAGSSAVDPAAQPNSHTHAILYANGQLTDLGTLSGGDYSRAEGLNNQGQVVGTASIGSTEGGGSFVLHAFLWQNGKISDLGVGNGTGSEAHAINDKGQAVGTFIRADSSAHAALWQNGTLQDLGISGEAYDINNAGQIVGATGFVGSTSFTPGSHAFVYQNGHSMDLNTLIPANSRWELRDAQAINEKGQICGTGTYKGVNHAYLLTPQQ